VDLEISKDMREKRKKLLLNSGPTKAPQENSFEEL
jgi:hypothetical protein